MKNWCLLFIIVFAVACDNGSKPVEVAGDVASDKLITNNEYTPPTVILKKGFECAFESQPNIVLGGTKIRFSQELVETVVKELAGKDSVEDFWSYLTPSSRKEIIYLMSLALVQQKQVTVFPYKALAVFFAEIAKSRERDLIYIFSGDGTTYSFGVSGENVTGTMMLKKDCDKDNLNMSTINLPEDVAQASNIQEVFHCITSNDSFKVVTLGSSTIVASHMDVIEVKNAFVERKESGDEINFKVDKPEISMKMKFYKNSSLIIKGIQGRRTKINIDADAIDIHTSNATCLLLKK